MCRLQLGHAVRRWCHGGSSADERGESPQRTTRSLNQCCASRKSRIAHAYWEGRMPASDKPGDDAVSGPTYEPANLRLSSALRSSTFLAPSFLGGTKCRS